MQGTVRPQNKSGRPQSAARNHKINSVWHDAQSNVLVGFALRIEIWERIATLLLSGKTPGKKLLLFGNIEDELRWKDHPMNARDKGRGPRRSGWHSDSKDGERQQRTGYEDRKEKEEDEIKEEEGRTGQRLHLWATVAHHHCMYGKLENILEPQYKNK